MWLLEYIEDLIDFRQYGGIKGNSICHYLIELVNFILSNQESKDPIAVLACMIDFSKAFNRQNHNLLITKLSDMGVPTWLLKLVMAFLSDRTMVVRYNGATSTSRRLPGGGPQGTLLGLLLFLVLINDIGFEEQINNVGEIITSKRKFKAANEIHLKYVDDLSIAEAINLKDSVNFTPASERQLPDNYHARTGHSLKPECSKVYKQIVKVDQYAAVNDMKINTRKTKFMVFSNSRIFDFEPSFHLASEEIKLVEEMKILGVVLSSDLKWNANTQNIVTNAFKRVWMLRRLKVLGTAVPELKDVYIKQIRSVLELAVPVWHSSLTQGNISDIERVQKTSLHIILGDEYVSYQNALSITSLEPLDARRKRLCSKFATKAVKHNKHSNWFKINKKVTITRQQQPRFCHVVSRTNRFNRSPISYLTSLLNDKYKKRKT